jgi:hypothetical protein
MVRTFFRRDVKPPDLARDVRDPATWGRPGHLTDSQCAAVDALRARNVFGLFEKSGDPLLARGEEQLLLRCLRARDFDVLQAAVLLEDMLRWREKTRPWEFGDEVLCASTASFHGYDTGAVDKDGRPVLYFLQRKVLRSMYACLFS